MRVLHFMIRTMPFAAVLLGCGCGSGQKETPKACPTPTSIRTVPVRLHRVMHTSGDSAGNPSNKGCRLSNAQIGAYFAQAKAFYADTCNILLTWDGTIFEFPDDYDDMCPPCSARNRRIEALWISADGFTNDPDYSTDHINIYFTGNLRFTQEGFQCGRGLLHANTVDPSAAGIIFGTIFLKQHIVVNDRAGTQTPAAARFVSGDRILEHELAHWFLRQAASQGGRYNDEEHCVVCTEMMKAAPPHGEKFKEVPTGICERYEIWLQAANWNDP